MQLYELTGEYLQLLSMLEDDGIPEDVIKDTLEAVGGEIEIKADNYAKIIKELNGQAKMFEKEKNRLEARQNTLENRINWLKQNLKTTMELTGKTKFKTDLFSFGIQKNGGLAPLIIDENADIPAEYCKKVPDNTLIRRALEEGAELGFAFLKDRGTHLSIR